MSCKVMSWLAGVMLFVNVNAQEMKNPVLIGPHFGYYEAKNADNGDMMFGAALRMRLANAFGFEAAIDYRQEEYRNKAITTKSWPVLLTGLIYPTQFIYGAVGVGWYNTQIDFHNELAEFDNKSSQKFGWHFGAGVEFPLNQSLKIASDFRYTFLDYDFGEVPGTSEIKSDYFIVTAGLFFLIN